MILCVILNSWLEHFMWIFRVLLSYKFFIWLLSSVSSSFFLLLSNIMVSFSSWIFTSFEAILSSFSLSRSIFFSFQTVSQVLVINWVIIILVAKYLIDWCIILKDHCSIFSHLLALIFPFEITCKVKLVGFFSKTWFAVWLLHCFSMFFLDSFSINVFSLSKHSFFSSIDCSSSFLQFVSYNLVLLF